MAKLDRHFFVVLLLALCSTASAALHPDQIAVVANSSFPGSRALAEYYCRARNIPTSHIISLAMPDGEVVANALYVKSIVPQLRQALARLPNPQSIRCFVTVRGVPLRIGSAKPTAAEQKLINILDANRKLVLAELDASLRTANSLAQLPDPPAIDPKKAAAANRGSELVKRTLDAFNQAAKKINSLPESVQKQQTLEALERIRLDLFGWAGQIELLKSQGASDLADPQSVELTQLQQKLVHANQQMVKLMTRQATFAQLDQAAGIARRSRGLLGSVQQLEAAIALIKYPYHNSGSSFDSELSLLLLDGYPRRGFLRNSLCIEHSADQRDQIPALMVSRIDAPTDAAARNLIDMAVRAEAQGLKGTCYIDAGWPKGKYGGYKSMEKSLLDTAEILTEHSRMPVVLDKASAVFAEGSCPDAALYCGWYSLRKYVDAFDFVPGAIGYHVASFELTTLRNSKYNGWATAMLRDGITATLGSVAEPNLSSFPPPDQFFTLILTGRYTLVECFYMTKRFNSWQLVLIGDPLYNPFVRTPRLTIPQAEQIINRKLP